MTANIKCSEDRPIGEIKMAINAINSEISRENHLLFELREVVFGPLPVVAGDCGVADGLCCSIVSSELEIIRQRIEDHNQRLSEIVEVLRNQLGDSLKLV